MTEKEIKKEKNKKVNNVVITEKEMNSQIDLYDIKQDILKRFKRKYKYELTLKEYSYVMDTLTIIIYIQNHIDNKETMNKGLNAYFKDYPQKININDDFNTNYDMLSFIFQCEDINVIKLILKNLIQKNIYFLEEN